MDITRREFVERLSKALAVAALSAGLVLPEPSVDATDVEGFSMWGQMAHLVDEAIELREAYTTGIFDAVANEMADVFIMAFWIAHQIHLNEGVAILEKLDINRKRKFTLDKKGYAKGSVVS